MARLRPHRVSIPRGRRDLGGAGAQRAVSAAPVSAGRDDCGGIRAPHRVRRSAAPYVRQPRTPCERLRARGDRPHHGRHRHGPLAIRRGLLPAAGEHRRADPGTRLCAAVPPVVRPRRRHCRAAGRLRLGVSDRLHPLDRCESRKGNLGACGASHGRRRPRAVSPRDPAGCAALHPHRPAPRPRPGVAHSGRRRDARGGAVGLGLVDLRRPRVSRDRRHALRHHRHRADRPCPREARLPARRRVHPRALGHADVTARTDRWRKMRRAAGTLVVLALVYEAVARSGYFPAVLLPTLPGVARALFGLLSDGTLLIHAAYTLARVLLGFALAVVFGLPLGIAMARSRAVENFVMPLASALMPIPSLAWVPVFILWFGLGDAVTVAIVFYAALFPLLLHTWTGVRPGNPLWLRAAGAMGADETALFWKVMLPGASPFIITGLRQAFLRSWIAVVGAEMIAGSDWGLGWVIYDAKEFLNADVMLASLAVIGAIGFAF